MKKILISYFLLSSFCFIFDKNKVQAQDFTVYTSPIIEELDGSITGGTINVSFAPDYFSQHVFEITSDEYPVGAICGPVYIDEPIDEPDLEMEIGALLGEGCIGKYCFLIVQDPLVEPCSLTFCVNVIYCTRHKEGRLIECPSTSPGPVGSFQTNPGNKILVDELKAIEREEGIVIPNGQVKKDFQLVNVYPVPFKQEINIEFQSTIREENDITISLLDVYGRTILSKKSSLNEGTNIFTLPINRSLPEGIYIIHVRDQNGVQKTKQITHLK